MDTTDRPLHTLDPSAVDAYIDRAIDQLFVPRSALAEAEPSPGDRARPAAGCPEEPEDPAEASGSPLDGLQEAVFSLEWEVCERHVVAFQREARALGERFPADRHVGAVVQMAAKVSKFLLAVGDGASPTGVGFPTAALRAFETLLREPAPSSTERRAAVEGLLEQYRRLQAEARHRPAKTAPRPAPDREAPAADARHSPQEAVAPELLDTGAGPDPGAVDAVGSWPAGERKPDDAPEISYLEPEPEEDLEPEPDLPSGTWHSAPTAAFERAPPSPGEEIPPELLEELPAPEHQGWQDAGPAHVVDATAAESPAEGMSADAFPETTGRLLACLEALRRGVQDRLGHAQRLPPNDSPRWEVELTTLGDLIDDGLTSALELTRRLVSAPEGADRGLAQAQAATQGAGAWRTELDRIHGSIEALAGAVRAIESRMGNATQGGPAATRGAPPDAPAYLAAVGGAPVAIPVPLLVKAGRLTPGLADRIRARGYATLGDFRSPFRSLKSGLSGPLAGLPAGDLALLRFPLSPRGGDGSREFAGAVLLSDGRRHAALFTDRVVERAPQTAAEHPRFHLGETAALPAA